MGLRHRSIRLRVGILIVVPILCLLGLYGFVASVTLGNALTEAHAKTLRDQLLNPVSNFQTALDSEQDLALLSLANPTSTPVAAEFGQQQAATDKAVTAMLRAVRAPGVASSASSGEAHAINKLTAAARRLGGIRSSVAGGAVSMTGALNAYDAIINDGYSVLDEAADQESSVSLVTQATAVINLDRVLQQTLAESDLLGADMTQQRFPTSDRIAFASLANQRQALVASTMPQIQAPYLAPLARSVAPALSRALAAAENAVIRTPWRSGPPPVQLADDSSAFGNYVMAMRTALIQEATKLQAQAQHQANTVFLELILAAGLGLIGIIASVALSLVIGRGLVGQLRELRESALTLAHDKLPNAISQLRAGEQVDVEAAGPTEPPSSNEIEQVQSALNLVQWTAIQSAVDEAKLRRGISDVFRNLAGRSQSLLHRQLTLLDGMERRASEPEQLEDLFRIDHLTTRMRRHAEGLIILSGETPARGWRQPVPLVDVLRAAVAEVEDYTRIRVLCRTQEAVAGHAVADVIHLIAELAENATVFSPPNTPVRIQGDVVGRGFAVEIEDRGLGISPERLAEINADLANPPQFDLSGSDRLGLFIAGQLAHRHDVKVTLRPSVYGGTTAIVLIPSELVVSEGSYERDHALPAGPASSQPDRIFGRHSLLAPQIGQLTRSLSSADLDLDQDLAGLSLAIPARPGLAADDQPAATYPAHVVIGSALDADLDGKPPTTELGLPVRVRQANLAPQLRNSGSPEVAPGTDSEVSALPSRRSLSPAGAGPDAPDGAEIPGSPEAARSTISALQRGWQLGWSQASTEAYPDNGTADFGGSEANHPGAE